MCADIQHLSVGLYRNHRSLSSAWTERAHLCLFGEFDARLVNYSNNMVDPRAVMVTLALLMHLNKHKHMKIMLIVQI